MSERSERAKQRIDADIIAEVEKDFVADETGYLFWFPNKSSYKGKSWPAYSLRVIAAELDRRNGGK